VWRKCQLYFIGHIALPATSGVVTMVDMSSDTTLCRACICTKTFVALFGAQVVCAMQKIRVNTVR
ncbi:hypothetical protein N7298_21545, partial [Aeromonas caviae]|uniref:hypothetical protein n=1 Tax=Aeromonas caviae TaxID=648 RepID=UPI00244AED6F